MQQSDDVSPSILYIVSTPIGNLDDMTVRGKKVLEQVARICCEDTRHSARLLDHLGIQKPLTSLHEHNEAERSGWVIEQLQAGESIALISDAGTPLISDPGFVLVNKVVEAGCRVVPVPGVSAVITALSVSGLPTDHFSFEGFLPNKSSARISTLTAVQRDTQTLVFYESSHRILDSLRDMATVFGPERRVVVARELTKTFETLLRGTLADVVLQVSEDDNQRKGEFVVMVAGEDKKAMTDDSEQVLALARELKPLLPPKKAAGVMAGVFSGNKKHYYELLLNL